MLPSRERFGGETFELYEDEDESIENSEKKLEEDVNNN
jgi:hypothetical protein